MRARQGQTWAFKGPKNHGEMALVYKCPASLSAKLLKSLLKKSALPLLSGRMFSGRNIDSTSHFEI